MTVYLRFNYMLSFCLISLGGICKVWWQHTNSITVCKCVLLELDHDLNTTQVCIQDVLHTFCPYLHIDRG